MNQDCSTCCHYYGKIENFRYFCCAMHPHGPEPCGCADWEQKTEEIKMDLSPARLEPLADPELPQELRAIIDRDLRRMRRLQSTDNALRVSLVIANVLMWMLVAKNWFFTSSG